MMRSKCPFRNGPVPMSWEIIPNMKPYDIAVLDDEDCVEVNMYGEVVSERPTDWWTGEPVDGLFIVLADFLNDMERIKNKKNVTFRINSPGGEVFAGVSIYNRMKEFTGNVTTIVDGLCASAASIIMQGAKPGNRKVCNGSLTMIHGASCFMYGYYNAKEMKDAIKEINAIDKSIASIYAKETGTDIEVLKTMMSNTAWMSAQDAIDKGFADEIINTDSKVTMSLNSTKSILTVNGVPMQTRGLLLPADIPVVDDMVTTGKEPEVINKDSQTGGKEKMTYDELMKQEPDLVKQIQDAATATAQADNQVAIDKALDDERKRLQAIDEIAPKIGDQKLVDKAKYGEAKMTAADLALEALKAQKDAGTAFLNNAEEDTANSGVTGVQPAPNSNQNDAAQAKEDITAGANLIATAGMK